MLRFTMSGQARNEKVGHFIVFDFFDGNGTDEERKYEVKVKFEFKF